MYLRGKYVIDGCQMFSISAAFDCVMAAYDPKFWSPKMVQYFHKAFLKEVERKHYSNNQNLATGEK